MKKLSLPSRWLVALGSISLVATYFLPVWFIFLIAPQYPEGLTMNIWLNKITGEVDIINGLNHYIGMKHIKAEMFPEFGYLIYAVGFLIVLGLLVAITGNRKLLTGFVALLLIGAIAAMVDFYIWGYDYGHNLDPKAAIQVPGLFYQPPLLGHKTLLNFDAYSYPDSGGWVIIIAGLLVVGVWILEWKKQRKNNRTVQFIHAKKVPAFICMLSIWVSSCSVKAEPFQYGEDICDDCKMTIMDPHFGAEIVTSKGRLYKFDDAHCLVHFLNSGRIKKEDIAQTVFVDFDQKDKFTEAAATSFVVSPQLKSPMNSNAAGFMDLSTAQKKASETGGEIKSWAQLQEYLK